MGASSGCWCHFLLCCLVTRNLVKGSGAFLAWMWRIALRSVPMMSCDRQLVICLKSLFKAPCAVKITRDVSDPFPSRCSTSCGHNCFRLHGLVPMRFLNFLHHRPAPLTAPYLQELHITIKREKEWICERNGGDLLRRRKKKMSHQPTHGMESNRPQIAVIYSNVSS